jgi:hypothetical protein
MTENAPHRSRTFCSPCMLDWVLVGHYSHLSLSLRLELALQLRLGKHAANQEVPCTDLPLRGIKPGSEKSNALYHPT